MDIYNSAARAGKPAWSRSSARLVWAASFFSGSAVLIAIIIVLVFHQPTWPVRLLDLAPPRTDGHNGDCRYRLTDPFNPDNTLGMTFLRDERYTKLAPEYDSVWDQLLPENGGFLVADSGLQKSHTTPHVLGVSMFHQLHCLSMIRSAIQDLASDYRLAIATVSEPDGVVKEDPFRASHHQHEHGGDYHWTHCLDYLRQSILCAADPTREPTKVEKTGMLFVDGMHVEHQCRDAKSLYEM